MIQDKRLFMLLVLLIFVCTQSIIGAENFEEWKKLYPLHLKIPDENIVTVEVSGDIFWGGLFVGCIVRTPAGNIYKGNPFPRWIQTQALTEEQKKQASDLVNQFTENENELSAVRKIEILHIVHQANEE